MIHLDGDFNVNTEIKSAYDYITNPDTLIKLVPDLIDYKKIDDNNLKITAKAGISFIKGKFDLDLSIDHKVENKHVTLRGKGNGSGASVDFTVDFDFNQNTEDSEIRWNAYINIVGTAASMGGKMMKSAINKYITKLVDKYKETIENN